MIAKVADHDKINHEPSITLYKRYGKHSGKDLKIVSRRHF